MKLKIQMILSVILFIMLCAFLGLGFMFKNTVVDHIMLFLTIILICMNYTYKYENKYKKITTDVLNTIMLVITVLSFEKLIFNFWWMYYVDEYKIPNKASERLVKTFYGDGGDFDNLYEVRYEKDILKIFKTYKIIDIGEKSAKTIELEEVYKTLMIDN